MYIIEKIASNSVLSLGIAIFGVLLSIFSIIFAIYVYKKDKTNKRQFDKIAKIVGDNIDIEDKEDKIKELSMQLDTLNKTINEEIPNKAKIAALQDRLDRSLIELADCYNNVLEIDKELQSNKKNHQDEKLSNEIFDKISREIEPKYLLNEKLLRYTIILFLSSLIINIISHIDVLDTLWNMFSTAFLAIEGIYVYKILKTYYDLRNSEILKFLKLILLSFAVIFLGVICVIINVLISDFNWIIIIFLIYSILGEIVSLYALFKVRNRDRMK